MADLDMAKLRALAEELGYWPGLSLWTAVLVREPHTQRRQRLIRPITVGTIGVEGRHNMEPRTALACVIVARTVPRFTAPSLQTCAEWKGWQRPGTWAGPDD